jgi:hypothetical protein
MGSFARAGARAACAAGLAWLALGCGNGSGGGGFTADAGGDDGACSAGCDDGAPGDASGGPDVGFGDDSATQQLGCSGDLQSVVDQNGHVVMQCPSDQGCSGGKCVPACQAAADSHGSIGCDYVLATPDFETGHKPPCFVVFIANSWSRDVKIGVQRAGTSYDVTTFGRIPTVGTPTTSWSTVPATGLPPNKVAVMFMSSDPMATNLGPINCPVADAINSETAVFNGTQESTGIGDAFHITTDTPVNGYDVIPYGGAESYLPSAELLLPTSAWGTNYVMVLPRPGNSGEMWGQIVASMDNTTVKIVPTLSLPAGTGVAAAPMGMVTSFNLSAGQYIQWQMPGFQMGNDFSGSIISSNNPVGVNGGNGILCLDSKTSPTGGGCDSEHELVPPVSALGFEYVAAPMKSRAASGAPESLPYRFVGTVKGTTLTFDPLVAGGPATLDVAQVADFEATGSFRVTSQDAKHPFYVAQMIPGCMVTGGDVLNSVDPSAPFASSNCLGDEDYTTVIPPAQWLQKYVFFTDPTYATTNIVLVRLKTSTGFQDVNVDCVGKASGWQPVGTSGNYEATNVDFIRGTQPQGACNNGPHTAQSNGPFALVVWGLDSYSSYGYPAGGNYRTINSVVVPLPQ